VLRSVGWVFNRTVVGVFVRFLRRFSTALTHAQAPHTGGLIYTRAVSGAYTRTHAKSACLSYTRTHKAHSCTRKQVIIALSSLSGAPGQDGNFRYRRSFARAHLCAHEQVVMRISGGARPRRKTEVRPRHFSHTPTHTHTHTRTCTHT
jgi:hypothetical protein